MGLPRTPAEPSPAGPELSSPTETGNTVEPHGVLSDSATRPKVCMSQRGRGAPGRLVTATWKGAAPDDHCFRKKCQPLSHYVSLNTLQTLTHPPDDKGPWGRALAASVRQLCPPGIANQGEWGTSHGESSWAHVSAKRSVSKNPSQL